MPTTTTNYSWNKPTVGGDEDAWGGYLNGNWDSLDTLLGGVTNTEFEILDGATVTTAELNLLDGVTATTAEINYLDGVTSSIQTQINSKGTGTVSSLSDLSITASSTELNIMDGVTATTAELNYVDITTLGTSQASRAVTADANGNIKLSEEVQATSYIDTLVALSGTSPTVDCDEGNAFTLSTSGNTTFTFDYSGVNLTTNDAFSFVLRVTAGGTHSLTWPGTVDWAGGAAPDAPASGETDVFVFFTTTGGSTWYGFLAGDALS